MEPFPPAPVAAALPDQLAVPAAPALTFEGFAPEAFAALDALRREPRVEAYRREKPRLEAAVLAPFRRYRDDLAVNLVLPNGLPWETERNVFSRLLKNDFGAGGCHYHLWMSFYRFGRKRLTDPQLSHEVGPDGFSVGLYAGDHYGDYFARLQARAAADPDGFRAVLDGPLRAGFAAYAYTGGGKTEQRHDVIAGDAGAHLPRARGLWVRTRLPAAEVVAAGPGLVGWGMAAAAALWPLYRYYAEAAG